MEFQNTTEAWAAIRKHYEAHRAIAAPFELGKLSIIHPDVTPDRLSLYILGFNGTGAQYTKDGKNELGARYIAVCNKAAAAVGVGYYIMAERCPWGSPTVGALQAGVGNKAIIREVLKLNAQANRALFREHPPLVVWALGLSQYVNEAIEDYDLGLEIDRLEMQKGARRWCLWRYFESAQGVPFLFTKHPAARPSRDEKTKIYAKLAELADDQRAKQSMVPRY